MIVEFLLDMICGIVGGIIDGLQIVTLPVDLIATLAKITSYGNAIVGSDLMIIIGGCIGFWIALRASFGLAVFVWKLLPLT